MEFIKKFKKETLAVLVKLVNEKKVLIAIVNDLAYPKEMPKILKYAKEKGINVLLLSGLWQMFFDGKYNLAQELAFSKIAFDSGLISLLVNSFKFRDELEKKLGRYFHSMILFGSWARGEAVKGSDIDLAVIIDDTDVKEKTRKEVREKLRNMIYGVAASFSKKFNIQVYLLTQFWEYVRDANPVIFTLLRDGVPIYDKGLFLPWKLLLKMGKIKPTPEAIESFISSSNLLLKFVRNNLRELVIERLYYAMLNPAQAALMFLGIPPPVYSETPYLLDRYFVKKGLLDKKYVKWLKEIIKLRKKVEHGGSYVDGKTFDKYFKRAEEFSKVINNLFEKIKKEKLNEKIKEIDYIFKKGMKEVLSALGIKASEKNLVQRFIKETKRQKLIPASYTDFIYYLQRIKERYPKKMITQEEINKLEKEAHDFIETILNLVKVRELKGTDKYKVECKYKNKKAEVWFLGKDVFIIRDVHHPEAKIIKAKIKKDGTLYNFKSTTIEELDKKRKRIKVSKVAVIKEKTFESLKKIFGEDLEVVISE